MTKPTSENSAEVPFVLACAHCDADSPDTLAEALQQGWTAIERDDGFSWNYLGICPTCRPSWEGSLPTQHP